MTHCTSLRKRKQWLVAEGDFHDVVDAKNEDADDRESSGYVWKRLYLYLNIWFRLVLCFFFNWLSLLGVGRVDDPTLVTPLELRDKLVPQGSDSCV
jgi:hypothetical protein